MGIRVEYNPDLALRSYEEFKVGRRKKEECLPEHPEEGTLYEFLKRDQRLFWLHGELPLLETKGNQNLSLPIASIVIVEATHFIVYGEVWTRGKYRIVELIKDEKVRFNGFSKI